MKKLLLLLALFISFTVSAQTYLRPNTSYGLQLYRLAPDSVLHTPKLNDTLLHTTYTTLPQLRTINDSIWHYNGIRWRNLQRLSGSGSAAWGAITGVLSDQVDLQAALNALTPQVRTLTINGVAQDLSANRSYTVGSVDDIAVVGGAPLYAPTVTGTTTKSINLFQSNAAAYTLFGVNSASPAFPAFFSPVLASPLFQNQGIATSVLHGNAAGNPSWGPVNLATDVTGNLPVTNLNGGTGAGITTFWRGDGTWGSPAGATLPDGVVSGCPVIWDSLLVFTVGLPCSFNIANTNYNLSAPVSFVLPVADPSLPRQDAIITNTTPTATSLTGTPATSPEVPVVNPTTQLFLTSVLVNAGATTPANIGSLIVRDQGTGGEWSINKTMTTTDNYSINPFHLTISQRITVAANSDYVEWQAPSIKSKLQYSYLIFYIRNNATVPSTKNFIVTLRNGALQVAGTGSAPLLNYGWTRAINAGVSYSLVAIPMSFFAGADPFDRIRLTATGAGAVDMQVDYIQLQNGVIPPGQVTGQIYFNTVADMKAYVGTTNVAAVTLGYYAANDGGGATYKYNSISTATDDGGLFQKATSISGGWELQYGSQVYLKQFGAKSDSTTDARPAFKLAMRALNTIPLEVTGVSQGHGIVIINRGKYYFSDSVQVRNTINIIGEGAGTYPYEETQILFSGIHGGFYFLQTAGGVGGRNCTLKNVALKSQLTNYRQTWPGIFTNSTILVDNVSIYNFAGDGMIVDTRDSGNANNCYIRLHADYNRRYGLSLWGNDSNNGEIYVDGNANGGSALHDQSFLGNHHKWVHSSFSGIRQPDNLSYVNVASVIYGAIQPSIAIQPGVTSGWQDYWVQQNNLPLGWTTTWRVDSTYFDACAIWAGGSSNASTFDAPYTESGQLPVYLGPFATILNGNQNGAGITGRQLEVFNFGNGMEATGAIQVRDHSDPNSKVMMDDGNGLNIGYTGQGFLQWKANAAFADTTAKIYANGSLQPTLSFPLKNLKGHIDFNVDTVYEGMPVFGHRGFWMSDNASTNYTTSHKNLWISGHALPTSPYMVYPTGAFMVYDGASADTVGARCITGGRGGTATWAWILAGGGGGGGSIGGTTGSTDRTVIVSDGAGGSTIQPATGVTINSSGEITTPFVQIKDNGTATLFYNNTSTTGNTSGLWFTTDNGAGSASGTIQFLTGSQGFDVNANAGAKTTIRNIYGGNSGFWDLGSTMDIYGSSGVPTNIGANGTSAGITVNTNNTVSFTNAIQQPYISKTANYTATAANYSIECTTGTFQITLPTAVGITGREYEIVNSGAGTITIGTTSGETFINVLTTPTTLTMSTVGTRKVRSNGAAWMLVGTL